MLKLLCAVVRHGARVVGWNSSVQMRLTFMCSATETVNKMEGQISGEEVLSELTEIIPCQSEV